MIMMNYSKTTSSLIGLFTLLGYLVLLVATPIHLMHMMDSKMATEHCPFELSHEVVCLTTIQEHVRTWQSWFEVFLPFSPISFCVYVLTTYTAVILGLLLVRLALYSKRRSWQNNRLLTCALFSQGILNTKVF